METGIELIAKERQEQFTKHRRTIEFDVKYNSNGQLNEAVQNLLSSPDDYMEVERELLCPENWDEALWMKMWNKPYKARLIIAGALIAAEIDRLNNE